MKGKQIVAVDVGSSKVVIAVGSLMEDGNVDILGIVSEPVSGIRAGRIDNGEQVARAIAAAKGKIEQQLGVHITEVYAGILATMCVAPMSRSTYMCRRRVSLTAISRSSTAESRASRLPTIAR